MRIDGYEVVIYFDDHDPPHVHVHARGCEAIFNLNCPDGDVSLRDGFRFKAKEIQAIARIVKENQAILCAMWKEFHDSRKRRD